MLYSVVNVYKNDRRSKVMFCISETIFMVKSSHGHATERSLHLQIKTSMLLTTSYIASSYLVGCMHAGQPLDVLACFNQNSMVLYYS